MVTVESREDWVGKCRRAEALGYDIIQIGDHIGMPAPFPSIMLAAEVTSRPRVGAMVINAGFVNPALLAREVFTVDRWTGGRLDIGLGAGYAREEFKSAGLDWEPAGARVDRLAALVAELDRLAADEEFQPRPLQSPRPPLTIAAGGDRMLRFAARHADTVALVAIKPAPLDTPNPHVLVDAAGEYVQMSRAETEERIAFLRASTSARAAEPELNTVAMTVVLTRDRRAAAEHYRALAPALTIDELLDQPSVLIGTPQQIAEQLVADRERLGISYITVLEPYLDAFGEVIELLK